MKFRRSRISIACYAFAAIIAIYFIASCVSTYVSVRDYYAAYQMTPGFFEVFGYILQNGINTVIYAVLVFMAGYILDAVRKLDPANYVPAAAAPASTPKEDLDAALKDLEEAATKETAEAEEAVEEAAEEAVETVAE